MSGAAGRPGRGEVVTFYSYKGGTGRTTALANVAWILAANGLRVLAVDWDLEAPGLERYFHPFLDPAELANRTGVIDAVGDFRAALARRRWSGTELRQLTDRHADVTGRVLRVGWPYFPASGRLDVLCAGQDGPAYGQSLAELDWNAFYSHDHGADFLRQMRAALTSAYDYVLVDSRTGLGDVAGICTLELPDTLVVCFTLSGQGIDGAAGVAQDVARTRAEQGRRVRILPVPTRVDGSEHERFEAGRDLARRRFAGFPAGLAGEALRSYWNGVAIPYRAYYAFEEVLAVFGDAPGDPNSLLSGCERLAASVTGDAVTGLPPMPESLRAVWRERYQRGRSEPSRLALLHGVAERGWALWAIDVLESAGLQVTAYEVDDKLGVGHGEAGQVVDLDGVHRVLAFLSEQPWPVRAQTLQGELGRQTAPDGQALLVRVRCGGEPHHDRELDLRQVDEQFAAQLLVRTVDPDLVVEEPGAPRGARFPGREPTVWNAPGRNPLFCGRASELERLRETLASNGRVVVLSERPGAGATELAREFSHRHRGDYDLVWWIPAKDPAAARAAYLLLLSHGRAPLPSRSLLVLDGADDPEALAWHELRAGIEGMRRNGGAVPHLLVTSRLPVWAEHAEPLRVGRMERSAALSLLGRAQAGPASAADRLAAALDDHAPALFLAGAYLAVTGGEPEDLLDAADPAVEPTQAVLVPSLALLRAGSPAAERVLRLCAALGGDTIAWRLLRDDRLLRELEELQPEVMDWASFAAVQGELVALGLIAADEGAEVLRIDARVREAVLQPLASAEREALARRVHMLLVARRLRLSADVDDERNWQRLEEIWVHLLPSGADADDEPEVRGLFIDFVRYLRRRGRPGEAERLAEVLHTRWSVRLPEADWRRLRLRAEWANALRQQDRHQDALDLDTVTLAAQEHLFGAEHVHTLITAGGYGGGLRALGRYQEALAVDRRTLAAMTARLGRSHLRTMAMINNLAVDHHLVGDYDDAFVRHDETYRLRRSGIGPAHPHTLASAAGVARAVRELGRPSEALDRFRRLSQAVAALSDLPLRALFERELAAALRLSGRHQDALELSSRVHAAAVRWYGADSPAAQACRLELAAAWYVTGAHGRAADAASEVHAQTVRRLGADHPEALCCGHNHALFLAGDGRDRKRAEAALSLLSPVVGALEARLGRTHPLTLSARSNQVGLVVACEGPEAVSECGPAVLEDAQVRRGADHPFSLLLAASLGHTGLPADRALESERLRADALPKLVRVLGRDHPALSTLRQGRWVSTVLDLPVW